jgi:hypothetical protein
MACDRIFDPEKLAELIEKLHNDALFPTEGEDPIINAPPECAQYFLLALAALQTAKHFATLAELRRARGD